MELTCIAHGILERKFLKENFEYCKEKRSLKNIKFEFLAYVHPRVPLK